MVDGRIGSLGKVLCAPNENVGHRCPKEHRSTIHIVSNLRSMTHIALRQNCSTVKKEKKKETMFGAIFLFWP
jgi:hypothetical protein